MEENTKESFFESQQEDILFDIDIKAIFEKLKKNWKFIIYRTFIAGIIGCLFAIGIPRQYKVESKIAPELSLRSSSLTSLASLTGVGMSSMLSGNNDAILPSVYPDIISSTPFLVDILESKVDCDSTLLSYMKYDMPKFWFYSVIGFPRMIVGKIKDAFDNDELTDNSCLSRIDTYRLTREQAAICKRLQNSIKVDVNKKNFVVTITVILPDKEVAAKVSCLIIENLKAYVTEYRTQKSIQYAKYLEVVADAAHEDYINAQIKYSEYLDRNQNVLLKSNLVVGQDLQNQVNLRYQLYSSLTTELQQARTKISQETPVFAEIVPPTVPTKSANSRKKIAVVFAFMGFIASCCWRILKK